MVTVLWEMVTVLWEMGTVLFSHFLEYKKWESGMSKPVLNFHNNNIRTISLLSDDGEVTKYKCNLCGKEFTVDRRLITFSE